MGIPEQAAPLLLRADFSDDTVWAEAVATAGECDVEIRLLEDHALDGITLERLLTTDLGDYPYSFVFVVDERTVTHPDRPLRVVGRGRFHRGLSLYVAPSAFSEMVSNLSLGNMDLPEYAAALDSDGVFRGFG